MNDVNTDNYLTFSDMNDSHIISDNILIPPNWDIDKIVKTLNESNITPDKIKDIEHPPTKQNQINLKLINPNTVKSAITNNDIETLVNFAKTNKQNTVFKYIIECDRLDILIKLSEFGININQYNVTMAFKKGKYEIVKWCIKQGIYPSKFKVYEECNRTNNFEMVEYLIGYNQCLPNGTIAKYAYEHHWDNVTEWLKKRNIVISDADKFFVDERKRKTDEYNEQCRKRDELMHNQIVNITLPNNKIQTVIPLTTFYRLQLESLRDTNNNSIQHVQRRRIPNTTSNVVSNVVKTVDNIDSNDNINSFLNPDFFS